MNIYVDWSKKGKDDGRRKGKNILKPFKTMAYAIERISK